MKKNKARLGALFFFHFLIQYLFIYLIFLISCCKSLTVIFLDFFLLNFSKVSCRLILVLIDIYIYIYIYQRGRFELGLLLLK